MRAMIVAAGLGTRLRPLSELRPKPALPVRGIPLIAYMLALLSRHGVSEVVINVHHLPEILMEAALGCCPAGITLRFSKEKEILDTGGGIARVADFLRESDPCLILAADMLLDADLSALITTHKARGDAFTMLLRSGDTRAESFGTIGANRANQICRIGDRQFVALDMNRAVRPACQRFPDHLGHTRGTRRTHDHLTTVLLLQTQRFLQRVGVRLVHLEAGVLILHPHSGFVDAERPLPRHDLLDAHGYFHRPVTPGEPRVPVTRPARWDTDRRDAQAWRAIRGKPPARPRLA